MFGGYPTGGGTSFVSPSEAAAAILSLAATSAMTASMAHILSPFHGLSLMQHTRKPAAFSGKDVGDWQRFVREWKPYEQILEKSYPSELHDTVKLEHLKSLLDSTTLADFQTRFEANGSITFQEFWDEIDREHGRDATHQNCTAWKKSQIVSGWKKIDFSRKACIHKGM